MGELKSTFPVAACIIEKDRNGFGTSRSRVAPGPVGAERASTGKEAQASTPTFRPASVVAP